MGVWTKSTRIRMNVSLREHKLACEEKPKDEEKERRMTGRN